MTTSHQYSLIHSSNNSTSFDSEQCNLSLELSNSFVASENALNLPMLLAPFSTFTIPACYANIVSTAEVKNAVSPAVLQEHSVQNTVPITSVASCLTTVYNTSKQCVFLTPSTYSTDETIQYGDSVQPSEKNICYFPTSVSHNELLKLPVSLTPSTTYTRPSIEATIVKSATTKQKNGVVTEALQINSSVHNAAKSTASAGFPTCVTPSVDTTSVKAFKIAHSSTMPSTELNILSKSLINSTFHRSTVSKRFVEATGQEMLSLKSIKDVILMPAKKSNFSIRPSVNSQKSAASVNAVETSSKQEHAFKECSTRIDFFSQSLNNYISQKTSEPKNSITSTGMFLLEPKNLKSESAAKLTGLYKPTIGINDKITIESKNIPEIASIPMQDFITETITIEPISDLKSNLPLNNTAYQNDIEYKNITADVDQQNTLEFQISSDKQKKLTHSETSTNLFATTDKIYLICNSIDTMDATETDFLYKPPVITSNRYIKLENEAERGVSLTSNDTKPFPATELNFSPKLSIDVINKKTSESKKQFSFTKEDLDNAVPKYSNNSFIPNPAFNSKNAVIFVPLQMCVSNQPDDSNANTRIKSDHSVLLSNVDLPANRVQESTGDESGQSVDNFEMDEAKNGLKNSHKKEDENKLSLAELLRPLYKYFVDNKCLLCGFVSNDKKRRDRKRHLAAHLISRNFKCNGCDKYFKTPANLAAHRANAHECIDKVSCDECGELFTRKSNLRRHIKRIHSKSDKQHICSICEKEFKLLRYLKAHLRIHTGEKPYECEVCDHAFRTKDSLKTHSVSHTAEKRHVCLVCNRSYYRKGLLKEHMNTHQINPSYKCEDCGKTFNFRSNLAQHRLVHSDNRKHSCEICGMKFKFPHHLRSHILTHK